MFFFLRHQLARRRTHRAWQGLAASRLHFSHSLRELRVRFLVDYFAPGDGLQREAAVAYLLEADERRLLLDLGAGLATSAAGEPRTRLRHNLETLGLDATPLDGVVITHNHYDHVGGLDRQRARCPNLEQLPEVAWTAAAVWTPIEMQHPALACRTATAAGELWPGIATTGPLPAHLYFLGSTPEQALIVNLGDGGTVLICGCGHPGIVEMVRFAGRLTGQPVRAVVGGLHLITSQGRTRTQKRLGANHPPWAGPSAGDVRRIAETLRELGVERVAPSAHDSCDVALEILREVFAEGYTAVRVGGEARFTA